MKRNILLLILTIAFLGEFAYAQTTQSGSRLNMTKTKKPEMAATRFSMAPSNLIYKPLSLQNPKAISAFYRNFLFAPNTSTETNTILVSEDVEKNIEKKAPAAAANIKSEEQLFSNDKISVSNIYPNPASEYAELDYNMLPAVRDAKVVFYNILGSSMNEFTLSKNEKKLRVNTREMPTGLYFYQLVLEGKKVATKKMLVRHQQ